MLLLSGCSAHYVHFILEHITPGFYTCRLLSVDICSALEVVCLYFITYNLQW